MQKGFIQLIIIIILLLVVISLMGISLLDIANNEILKKNFGFAWEFSTWLWDNYLHSPVKIAWRLWVEILWEPFVSAMKGAGQGEIPAIGQ